MEHPLAIDHKEAIGEEDIESPIQDQTGSNPSYEAAIEIQSPEYYASFTGELFLTLKKLSENGFLAIRKNEIDGNRFAMFEKAF